MERYNSLFLDFFHKWTKDQINPHFLQTVSSYGDMLSTNKPIFLTVFKIIGFIANTLFDNARNSMFNDEEKEKKEEEKNEEK